MRLRVAVRVHRTRTLQACWENLVESLVQPCEDSRQGAHRLLLPGSSKDGWRHEEEEKHEYRWNARPDCTVHKVSPVERQSPASRHGREEPLKLYSVDDSWGLDEV